MRKAALLTGPPLAWRIVALFAISSLYSGRGERQRGESLAGRLLDGMKRDNP